MTKDKFLRNALKANATFSALSGIALISFSQSIAELMNIGNSYILLGIGVGLLLFVATIWMAARRSELKIREIKSIIIQDWAWVIGSAILLIWRPVDFTLIGMDIIIAVAVVVATLAIVQQIGIRLLKQQ